MVNEAPVLVVPSVVTGNEKELIHFTASATVENQGTAELQFSLGESSPEGAGIHATTGLFSWTPAEVQGPAEYLVLIRVSDGKLWDEKTITLQVNEVNEAPVITSVPPAAGKEGELYSYRLTATDADLPANTLSYELLEAPSWLSFDPENQLLQGTPGSSASANHLVRLAVHDGQLTTTQEFTITTESVTGLFNKAEMNRDFRVFPNPGPGPFTLEPGGQFKDQIISLFL